ncbi:DUF393 domain-containing protein [Viridibacillus sp. YIM B01967]|uniref:DUF393 domain-containing protein n=1 Tax=Viridibacillus soli TaxID=2798301 RepID=A0ABS1HCN8_9BACL|nr:DUF393 domain-containing protein [Viridibacillus soli]MBK3497198.1 DUF393 domain-containing protein [Viridibacillus soli]
MSILIYDGQCNMCSRFIRFIVKINKNPTIKITNFDSQWSKDNIDKSIDSMIFFENNKKYIYSDAVINILISANRLFLPLVIVKIIPKFIRNSVYKFIAKHRRKIMKNKHCPLPSKEENNIFL